MLLQAPDSTVHDVPADGVAALQSLGWTEVGIPEMEEAATKTDDESKSRTKKAATAKKR
ncbi:hypothetical protein KRX51_03200 [Corynebacterium sp. TAE3-ERU12]|uniref:hypothetical protein n=1 Tax=Corynebacterium sp. TAE3-ERU12 TaxID=2849491 RepID=UPI001C47F206|nr:hypothetical protein [Corynebacterium sp. TAE3-ERU12]MBV7294925.1 hypothetical protein [Corynebacterium sp. TAE3-ERU12]